MNTPDTEDIKLLILKSKEPLLFKNILKSDLLKWTLNDWARKLKDEVLEFRLGKFEYTAEPQWERKTDIIKSSFQYFLHRINSENEWLYFDYKYLNNWFVNVEELRNSITWAPLGFPNITMNDCTIWIGTKGAHTPCHIDTYGFNLIFQVTGRKLWIIAPPEENLKPTRMPYEESSIYSKLNFFSPTIKDFKGVGNCRKIVLNPGEVLYLPHKWWHYVENLDAAISINVWVPLPEDDEERLNESIVQFFVKQMVNISNEETRDTILNPNMQQPILSSDAGNMLEVINKCKNICHDKLKNKKPKGNVSNSTQDTEINVTEIYQKYNFVEKVPKMSQEDFNRFLVEQSSRFKNTEIHESSEQNKILELLDVFTDNDIVSLIREKLLTKNS